jgi:hypothetical protein
MSRTKDIVMESSMNPLKYGYCHYFGLTGAADKAMAMYDYMHDNFEGGDDDEMYTIWAEMTWNREYC